jgi:hypothetical protein
MSESWLGLTKDCAANLLSFSTHIHTQDFDNHINGYVRSKTALIRSVSGSLEI